MAKTYYTIQGDMWDNEKNGNLTPDMFTKGSEKVIWLKCTECGKSYSAKVKDIFRKNSQRRVYDINLF